MINKLFPGWALRPVAAFFAVLLVVWWQALQGNTFIVYLYGVGLVYATATLGLHLLVNDAGDISLAQGGQIAISAFAGAHLFGVVSGPFSPVALMVGSLLAGAVSGAIVSVPMLKLRGLAVAVVTLLLNATIFGFALRFSEFVGGSGGIRLRSSDGLLPENDTAAVEWLTVITIITVILIQALRRGRFGQGLRAIRANDALARSAGIPVAQYRMAAYTIAGGTAGVAGAMWVLLHHGIAPSAFTEASSLLLLTLALLGGRGSPAGPMAAAIAMGVLTGLLGGYGILMSFLAPAALLVVLIQHPGGINEQLTMVAHGLRTLTRRLAGRDVARGAAAPDITDAGEEAPPSVEDRKVWLPAGRRPPRQDGLEPPLMGCSDVDVAFDGLVAVRGVSLEVRVGEVLALMGPNGAGKTTLLNVLSGHLRPFRGTIWMSSSDITCMPAHRRAGRGLRRTFQVDGHMPTETGLDHLRLGTHVLRPRAAWDFEAVMARTGRKLGLTHTDLARPLVDLPAGTARLVEIGMALASPGLVLLLDEPTVGLSADERSRLVETVSELADGQLAIILVDHDTNFVQQVAHRVVALEAGLVIAEGTPYDVFADSAFIAAYLGSTTTDPDSPEVLV